MAVKLRKILICRTDAIGDSLLTLPVCAALKRAFPQSRLTFLASTYAADILDGQAGVDEVWTYAPESEHRGLRGLRRLTLRLRQGRFDAAFLVFPDRRVSVAAFWARIPVRVGTARRLWSVLYTRRVSVSRARGSRHETEYNLDLVRALGIPAEFNPTRLRIFPEAEQWARAYVKSLGVKADWRLIVLHPGGRGSAANWPLEKYQALARQMVRWPKTIVLLTGSQAEQAVLSKITEACVPRPAVLTKPVTLKQLAALIGRAAVLISGNTGPMHLAAGLGVPTVSFFPPSGVTGPGRWRPLGNAQAVLTPPEAGGIFDMNSITVDVALQAVRKFFPAGKNKRCLI